jgi:hypothetical protein
MMKSLLLAIAAISIAPVASADIIGTWKIHGSVFFNGVDTICHFKADDHNQGTPGVAVGCENYGQVGEFRPVTITGNKVAWDWDAGPGRAILTFQAALTSDTAMKGDIKVQGFSGSFTATKQP